MAQWYNYIVGDPFTPSSYARSPFKPLCLEGANVCSIYLPDSSPIPSTPFDTNTINYINLLLVTKAPQPQGAKWFVYAKPCC